MVNAKNVAFKVNKQTPVSVTPGQAYGTIINCRKPSGKRAPKARREVQTRHVRLSNIDTNLKRKRCDEEQEATDSKSTVEPVSSNTAQAVESRSDRPALKWQPLKPTRLRKNKILTKEVDLDCWFTILSFSPPAQLLEMRQKLASCYRFLRDNPMLWKHSRNNYYGNAMPDPPSEITEFQFAHLRHGHGCMSCKAPNTRKTYWAFLRRWCKTCLQSKTIKEHDALIQFRDVNGEDISVLHECLPVGTFDSWGNFVGVGPATTHSLKTVYLAADVRDLVAEYIDLKASNEDPKAWPTEVRAWHAPKVKLMEERKAFAHKMEAWEEASRSERSYDYQAKKLARKVYFQDKAAQLTPPITSCEMEKCPSYRRAIAIPKDPNSTSWQQLRPKLEKEAAQLRSRVETPDDHAVKSSTARTSTPNGVTEPPRLGPARIGPLRLGPPCLEPSCPAPARLEPPNLGPLRLGPLRFEPPRLEPPRPEPPRLEPPRSVPTRLEPPQPEHPRRDATEPEHPRLEPPRPFTLPVLSFAAAFPPMRAAPQLIYPPHHPF